MKECKKILTVASSGGHWEQLLQLKSVLEGHDVIVVSTKPDYEIEIKSLKRYFVNDAHLENFFGLIRMALRMFLIIFKERPDLVISTGAAPGFFGIMFGKLTGAKTIWIDSIANVDKLSRSGKRAGYFSDLWLTQWEHLALPKGPHYKGKVI